MSKSRDRVYIVRQQDAVLFRSERPRKTEDDEKEQNG